MKIADGGPDETKDLVAKIKAGMKDDSFEVFSGPIVDNAGKERLPKDQKADRAWKDKVDFFVAGVEGKVPSGS